DLFKPNKALEPGVAERLLLRGLNPVQNVLDIGMHSHVLLLAARKFEESFMANTFSAERLLARRTAPLRDTRNSSDTHVRVRRSSRLGVPAFKRGAGKTLIAAAN